MNFFTFWNILFPLHRLFNMHNTRKVRYRAGYGQNVPMPKRTQPKRTQFWSKRTHFFGQNVPSLPKHTKTFGQNAVNRTQNIFLDIRSTFLLFWLKMLSAHWSKRTQHVFQSKNSR